MTCPAGPCKLEQERQSADSHGPVADGELICRGVFDPRHGNSRTRLIKTAIVEKKSLAKGQQSAYRAGRETGWHLEDLRDWLMPQVPSDQVLFQISAVKAGRIRAISSVAGPGIRVLDETACDPNDATHPNHVHISPCRSDPNHPLHDPEAPWVRALVEDLANLFRHADHILNLDP